MSSTNKSMQSDIARSRQKTKLLFGGAALLSFFVSVSLWFSGQKESGLYVGLWVPSILSAGGLLLVGEEQ